MHQRMSGSCSHSDSFLVTCIKLLILHFLSFRIILAGIFGVLSCLLNFSLHFHLLLLCHSFFGRKMLEFIVVFRRTGLMRKACFTLMIITDFLCRLNNWSIFYVNSVLVPNSHTARINEFNHLLSNYGHLKDLRN